MAIARAVVRDPALLLLDEATSALDGASEAAVASGLERHLAGRQPHPAAMLVVAHRLSTVRHSNLSASFRAVPLCSASSLDFPADARARSVVVLHKGGVAEAGTCASRRGRVAGTICAFQEKKPSSWENFP